MTRQIWIGWASALVCAITSGGTFGSVAFGDAAVARHGAGQRQFIEGFLAAKPAKSTPAKSLVASHFYANSSEEHPSMDLLSMAKDPGVASEVWLLHAESLYASGQYVQSGIALQNVLDPYRSAQAARVESLQVRLALRGAGKLTPLPGELGEHPFASLNKLLLLAQSGDLAGAITRAAALVNAEKTPSEVRQRATVWWAIFLHRAGRSTEAVEALSGLDGASVFLVDALLSYLRIGASVHPTLLAAIERVVSEKSNDPVVVWEVREHLIKALLSNGAFSQAQALAIDSVKSLGEAVKMHGQTVSSREKSSLGDLVTAAHQLSEVRRHRVLALTAQRDNLQKTSEILSAWRPHLSSYFDQLKKDRVRFFDETQLAIDELRRLDDAKLSKSGLLNLELTKLFGKPSDRSAVYRLFFGLALWDFSYEYPESWRPPPDEVKELSRTERRRAKVVAQRGGRDDAKLLSKALDQTQKMQSKLTQVLANTPRHVYEGMEEEAKALLARGQSQAQAIAAFLPQLDGAVRGEFVLDAKDRRKLAQQWLNRFAHVVLAEMSRDFVKGDQPVFGLDGRLLIRPGEPIGRSISAVTVQSRRQLVKDPVALPVLDALKLVVAEGETRQIRADALRLRARLVVALNEMQLIPSALEAVEHYAVLLRDYGDLVDRADVTYQLARAQDLSQKMEASLATLEGFVRDFKGDARAVEATFRIGEAQFSLSENSRAKLAYESVVNQGETRYRDQAEYKLGWTLFRLGEHRAALPKFVSVIDRAYGRQAGDDKTQQNRMQDAFRAVSLTFSYLGGAADVEQFFQGKAKRDYVPVIYATLARYYLERKRVNDAATSYAYLNKHYPNDVRAPDLLAAVIASARKEKLNRLALDLQEQFVDRYAHSGSYWTQATPEARAQIAHHMKPLLADSARMYHADAQQNKNVGSYAKAIRFYQQFINTFPDDKQTSQFQFLLAEARFESGDTQGAMLDYERAAYDYGAHEKASEAGYALLIASQKQADAEKDPAERKAKLHLLVARSSKFAATFAGDARVDAVMIKAGEDILMLGEPSEAVRLGEALLARKPSESVARRALTVLAHGHFESGAFAKAEGRYVQLLALKGFSEKDHKDLNERLALSVYRQGEAYRAAGDHKRAIETFLRVVKVAPGTESVPSAEIDASALLLSGKRWGEAIEVLERFSKNYAGHRLNAEVPVRLAFAYESDGRFIKAADMLESLSHTEKDDALARQMHWRSAELREKGDRMDLAVLTYERYLVRYPQPLEKASEVRQSLADLAGKANDIKTRDRWLTELISHAKAAGGQETVRVRYLAAMASVVFGDDRAADFGAIKLKLPLDKSLIEKRRSMEAALKWYEEAGRYGIAEVTTAATYKTAELYRGLARDVMGSERPGGLNALEKDQYAILLEEEAAPFEEKATDLHELNYKRIPSGIYDAWVKKSLVSLSSINPGRYERPEIIVPHFPYAIPKLPATGLNQSPAPVATKAGGANAQLAR